MSTLSRPLRTVRRLRRARLVLWLAMLALAMNALAGFAHIGGAAPGKAALEICTHAGIVRLDAPWLDPQQSEAPDAAAEMRCCDVCGARTAVVPGDADPKAVIVLGRATITARAPPAADARRQALAILTPLVPRGPPDA